MEASVAGVSGSSTEVGDEARKNGKRRGRRSKSWRDWVATVGILSFTEKDRKPPMNFEQLSGMIRVTFHRRLRWLC